MRLSLGLSFSLLGLFACTSSTSFDQNPGSTGSSQGGSTGASMVTGGGGGPNGIDTPQPMPEAIAIDAAGFKVIVGSEDDATFSITKSDLAGNVVWKKKYGAMGGGCDSNEVHAAVDAASNIVVAATCYDVGSIGASTITPISGADLLVAKFDSDGAALWAESFGTTDSYYDPSTTGDIPGGEVHPATDAEGLGVDGNGDLVIGAGLRGQTAFGGQTLQIGDGSSAVVKITGATGAIAWAKQIKNYGTSIRIAVDAAGDVVAAATQHDGSEPAPPGTGFVLERFDASGAVQFSKTYDSPALVDALAVDAAGDFIMSGSYEGALDFATGPMPGAGVFVTKLDASGGFAWMRGMSGEYTYLSHLAVDAEGHIVLGAAVSGTAVIAGLSMQSVAMTDLAVAWLDGDGDVTSLRSYSTAHDDTMIDLAVLPSNDVELIGTWLDDNGSFYVNYLGDVSP